MTVEKALDQIVLIDPRYEWRRVGNAIALRPRESWLDSENILSQSVKSFTLVNQTFAGALGAVFRVIEHDERNRSSSDNTPPEITSGNDDKARRISIRLDHTTLLEVLSTIAATHERLLWQVSYCRPSPKPAFAIVRFETFDNSGGLEGHSAIGQSRADREGCY